MKIKIYTTILLVSAMLFQHGQLNGQSIVVGNDAADLPLNEFIKGDTLPNGSQKHTVYQLKRDGYYVLSGTLQASTFDLTLEAENGSGLKPVIILGVDVNGNRLGWNVISTGKNFTAKNIQFVDVSSNGNYGWTAILVPGGKDATITFDGCIIDFYTGDIINNDNSGLDLSYYFSNNVFRYGGVGSWYGPWSGFGSILKNVAVKMLSFENNTIVDAIAPFLVLENGNLENFWFNHNTVVNHGQYFFRSEYWTSAIMMNNLFVNAHFMGETTVLRTGQDPDGLPYGVITVAPIDTTAEVNASRILLFAKNNNYVSPEIKTFWTQAAADFDTSGWKVADVTKYNGFLNSRALSMMHDNANYPKFIWDDQKSVLTEDPSFSTYESNFDGMLAWARKALGQKNIVDNNPWMKYYLPQLGLPQDTMEFSYTNAVLKASGYRGFPVGDLNWFPAQKATWQNDANKETYAGILAQINNGTFNFDGFTSLPGTGVSSNTVFMNPNPVSSTANLTFSVQNPGLVTVKIFDLAGKAFATPINEVFTAGNHTVSISVSGLKSGAYLYQVKTGSYIVTQKMVVLK